MRKIKTLGLARLRMDECFGFLKLIEAETANLPLQGKEETDSPSEISLADTMNVLDAKVNMFINALNDFDAALKAPDSNPATPMTEATDNARDAAWRRTYNFVTAMGGHPDEDIAKASAGVKALFDKYGEIPRLTQTGKSGFMHNLLQDLDAVEAEKRTAMNLDIWIANLRAKEEAYLAAATERTEANANRQIGITKTTREAAQNAYRSLVDAVNALTIINGDADYATFIDNVNAMIERQTTISKARFTRAKKEEEEEEIPTPEA